MSSGPLKSWAISQSLSASSVVEPDTLHSWGASCKKGVLGLEGTLPCEVWHPKLPSPIMLCLHHGQQMARWPVHWKQFSCPIQQLSDVKDAKSLSHQVAYRAECSATQAKALGVQGVHTATVRAPVSSVSSPTWPIAIKRTQAL